MLPLDAHFWIVGFLAVVMGTVDIYNSQPCIPRDFGRGSVVCVCNSTYCDLPAKLDIRAVPLPQYHTTKDEIPVQVYTSTKAGLRLHKSNGAFTRTFSTFSYSPNGIYDQEIEKRSVQDFLSRIMYRSPLLPVLGFQRRSTSRTFSARYGAPDENPVVLRVRREKRFQEILGLGGSFTDAAGENIRKLSWSTQKKLMESYFSPAGSDYSLGRVPIGGTDFSRRAYTYDDLPANTFDYNLTNFALQPEDLDLKIPFIKWAQSLRSGQPLNLIASPWSAPVWMKTNRRLNGAGMLRREFYQVWANYFVKFLEAYAQQNIDIWAVTTGNEPFNGFVPAFPFNCMAWTPTAVSKWIGDNLGPTLKSKFPQLRIITVDDSKILLPSWGRIVLDPAKPSADFVDGVGTHWYFDFLVGNSATTEFHNKHPNHFIVATEACLGFVPWEPEKVILGSWERGETYLGAIINDMRNWVGGWIDWNLALDMTGGPNWAGWRADAAILVNPDRDEFFKQPIYYGMAHMSKFVPPGSIRIGLKAKNVPEDVTAVGFIRPDDGTVIVLLNKGLKSVKITLEDDDRGQFLFKIPPRAMQSIVYW